MAKRASDTVGWLRDVAAQRAQANVTPKQHDVPAYDCPFVATPPALGW